MYGIVWFPPVVLLLFGLIFGSFANVVIWRFPRGESLASPGSHCPHCGVPIRWYDNIPIASWILLRGVCRACGGSISCRYPIIEAMSGALWLLAWALFGMSWRTPFAIVFFYVLMILAAIDLDTYRLPNALVAVLGAVGLLGVGVSHVAKTPASPLLGTGSAIAAAAWGAVLSAGIALAIAVLYAVARKREGFGMGDVKLLAVMGLFLGPYGVGVLFVGSVLGAIVGVVQALRSGSGLAAKIPFGPFLAVAAVMVAIWGEVVWAWYWGLMR